MINRLTICLVLLFTLFVTACNEDAKRDRSILSPRIGEHMKMPHFNLPSATENAMVDSKQFAGKVLLVNFFATWCPPCIQEIPTFNDLQMAFKDKGFSVIGISVDEGGVPPVKKLIDKTGINYPVVMADSQVTRDFGGVTGIPVTYLVNRKGEVVKKYLGYIEYDVLDEDIKKLLGSD
jgi:thiol-disulfide isomerase/thioredoxin